MKRWHLGWFSFTERLVPFGLALPKMFLLGELKREPFSFTLLNRIMNVQRQEWRQLFGLLKLTIVQISQNFVVQLLLFSIAMMVSSHRMLNDCML